MSSEHLPLGDGAEFDAIRAMLAEWGPHATGVGDDAALLAVPDGEQLVVSTDATMEGVHFRRDWLSPAEIGERAASAALSDLAAMAATPLGLLLALGVPESWQGELPELARGVGAAAAGARCPIVGGNLTRASELSLTITVLGSTTTPLGRAGVRAGDRLFVTGQLGGPGAALRELLAGRRPQPAHRARFAAPIPRLQEARWLAARGAHAAIDVSDGLLADAAHLARASHVTLALDLVLLPLMEGVSDRDAAASGEEYELLLAAPADASIDAVAFAHAFGIPLTEIGRALEPGMEPVLLAGGDVVRGRGHDHLR
jgi:thiamine-monophosphate kinase